MPIDWNYKPPASGWTPGAWTPSRCDQWQAWQEERRLDLCIRLEDWIMAEKDRGECHKTQLPDMANVIK